MSAIGLAFDIKRTGAGDVSELFYALKDELLEWTWNTTTWLTGMHDYLASEEFATFMADRWDRNEKSLFFAFWEDVERPLCEYAIHLTAGCIASEPEAITELCAQHGFSIDLSAHLRDRVCGDFAMHNSSRVCTILPWRRGEPIDAAPRFACSLATPHRGKPPTPSMQRRLRNCAMTGLCACKTCCAIRARPGLDTDAIARAWKALDGGPVGVKLVGELEVLGDWLEERDAKLDDATLAALARRYAEAEPMKPKPRRR